MPAQEDKASHYIALLNEARVNGAWAQLPELIRKVSKHAPQKKLLVSTAVADHHIATDRTRLQASSNTSTSDSDPLRILFDLLKSRDDQSEDDFVQGKAALLWALWSGTTAENYTKSLESNIEVTLRAYQGKSISVWTKICLIRSAFIEGTAYARLGDVSSARSVYTLGTALVKEESDLDRRSPQLAYWSEQLLAALVILLGSHDTGHSKPLEAVRYWSVQVSKTNELPSSTYQNNTFHYSRLSVWREYYRIVSQNVQSLEPTSSREIRSNAASELRKVETAYENDLLRVHKFPRALDSNERIEDWVESVIRNWQVLCGPEWRDADLGEGGRNAVARNVLDILYRAASKTFHSILILRRLFQVHKSLAEFDLSYKALDTYMELAQRARDRAAKSTEPESGQDTKEVFLATVAEGLEGLCSFGRRTEARRAIDLCSKLEGWLIQLGIEHPVLVETGGAINGNAAPASANVNEGILELVLRSIGIAKAHWARWTPFSERRAMLQEEAIRFLKRASEQQPVANTQLETLYALSLVLAETRDINGALTYVKRALSRTAAPGQWQWTIQRKMISLWHLLALLLSSREDFDGAARSCTAAFEQFPSGDILLGSPGNGRTTNAHSEKTKSGTGLLSEMESEELQNIIEVRVTELALTELSEGPEEAVNRSNILLSMFSQVYAHLDISINEATIPQSSGQPKTSTTVARSIRDSVLGRRKQPTSMIAGSEKTAEPVSPTSIARPGTTTTQAPTIQITDEDGSTPTKRHLFRHSASVRNSKVSFDRSSRKLTRKASHKRNEENSETPSQPMSPATAPSGADQFAEDGSHIPQPLLPQSHDQSVDVKQDLKEVEHNLGPPQSVPVPVAHKGQPPQQDLRLPTVHPLTNSTTPAPRFPKAASQKRAFSVLTDIWLLIAALYRRSQMFDDSREAIEEAKKAATRVEKIVKLVDSSARALADAGWGGGKSVDSIWADVYYESAELQVAKWQQEAAITGHDERDEYKGLRSAVDLYEQCLMLSPDHPGGVVGLSNLLLDYYEKKNDIGRHVDNGKSRHLNEDNRPGSAGHLVVDGHQSRATANGTPIRPQLAAASTEAMISAVRHTSHSKTEDDLRKTPENLNRIAARDRAYGLLSGLTKLGTGWDNSEAWAALARAHELGGEIDKAKNLYWWVVELEDTRPLRRWSCLPYTI